jgi:hypothetical protein
MFRKIAPIVFLFEFIVRKNSVLDHFVCHRVDNFMLEAFVLFVIQKASSHSKRMC